MGINYGLDIQDVPIIETKYTQEDEHEGSLRPKNLKEYIGQEKAKGNLAVFIEAAKKRREPLDHVLLHGPPGLGKTTLAGIIASEMGGSLHITSGPALGKKGDLASMLSVIRDGDVLFIDEIHRVNPAVEEILYPAMEDNKIDIFLGKGPSGKSVRIDIQPFTLIGATTRAGQLSAPLRDRFGVTLRLELYSPNELARSSSEVPKSSARRYSRKAPWKSHADPAVRRVLPIECLGVCVTLPIFGQTAS